jgi:uncharacterized protein
MDDVTLKVVTSLSAIGASDWDACANPDRDQGKIGKATKYGMVESIAQPVEPDPDAAESKSKADESLPQVDTDNPFISHAFLSALEDAGCVGGKTGWDLAFLILENGAGKLLGAVPAYFKNHSQGEYVFDHAWAEAMMRAGCDYYPKLQVSVPFTPATGPRILAGARPDSAAIRTRLIAGLEAMRAKTEASSIHITFTTATDQQALEHAGYLTRHDLQYHWMNKGYRSYDDFLGDLQSRKRKALKRERREAVDAGIEIVHLTGKQLTESHWDSFFSFYLDTGARKWGRPYLNRRFFSLIGERMADKIVLVMARRGGRDIAGALNFLGARTLYGRHWGCVEEHPFLHFELCYHQAIDIAIARNLAVVEAGAQGEHKLARGYQPILTQSAHAIDHPGLRRGVAQYLAAERSEIDTVRTQMAMQSPFRNKAEEITANDEKQP